ncbi:hypothetical protein [Pseudalkalibacillus decolorationis]|uniref:hypothetical protein n=1 Tax=Pseudalkalibacillus decolorationis TaxID=163879 RepID=UPI002148FDBB|nr:hypothetical protein [Pseudalkalibacillus decolorationis]
MLLGGAKLNCKQQVMVYDNYEIINYADKKGKALTRIEEELRCYIDRYAKNYYRAEGFLRHISKRLNSSIGYNYILVAPMASADASSVRTLNPISDLSNLFIDLSKIGSLLDEKAIVKFFVYYGLPIREGMWLSKKQNIDIPFLFLNEFDKELTTYKEHFELFLAYKNDDYIKMRNFRQSIINNRNNKDSIPLRTKEGIKHDIRRILTSKIKSRDIKYEPSLGPDDFSTEVIFGDLIDVAYFQIGQALISDVQLGICLECGDYFVRNHGNTKYCPPPPNGKRSTCQNRHQVNSYREKIKKY